MITANELRIGNLIQTTDPLDKPIICQVTGIDQQLIMSGCMAFSANRLLGIPLTPEWLKKCGFVTGSGPAEGFIVGTNGARVRINFTLGGYDYFDTGCFIRNLQFVHELQNLFYAINSMELKISL